MFSGCYGLASLDLSSFNTAEVTNMSGMFGNCSALTSLDVSSFNTVKVTNMSAMFSDCSSLNKIYVSDDFSTDKVSSGSGMFDGCSNLNGYDSNKTDHTMANCTSGYFTKSNLTPCVKWNEDTKVLIFKVANYIEGTAGECEFNEGAIALEGVDLKNNCKKVVFTPSFKQVKPTSCYKWFDSFSNLTTIQGIENLNTEKVKNMMYMFYGCKKLTSLDLSKFNTAKVWEMGYMFGGCSGLTSLDLSSFDTANVKYMMNMFIGCKGLTSLDLSSFNTAKVESMNYMFNGCSGLTTINVSDAFTTNKVSNSDGMFGGCYKLEGATSYNPAKTGIDMANFDGYFTPKNITPYVKWDANTNVLTFKVANKKEEGSVVYDLNKGANPPGWFVNYNCEKVVFTPSFKQAKPTSCCSWFWGLWQLTTIEGIENLNTEEVTDMSEMFNGCSGLKSLDLSNFDTSNVEDMTSMFTGCNKLTSLNLSNFNTANVTDMSNMFADCQGLTSLDLSSFNTAKVEDMSSMFNGCSGLTKIYVGDGFTTGTGTNGSDMFYNCTSLVGADSYSNSGITDKSMANYKDGYFKTYFTFGENKVELCGNPLTTESLDLTGDYDFTPKDEFKANEATYSRDLSSSGATWFSLCLPFAYTPANFNFTAYQLKGATANAVEIEEITGTIAAGTPVLFKFKDGVVDVDKKIEIFATGANIVNAPVVDGSTAVNGPNGSSLQLCGTYQTKTFTSSEDDNAFILLNDKLMNPAKMLAKGVTKVGVKPFRAYMTLTAPAQQASARAFSIGRGGEGNEGTTAIDLLNSVATDDAEYYDINGRRIDAPVKGVNIVRRGNKTIKLIIK
ncbi:MAG: BspA family leucine-rich repeat surface protein, partial [Prevotellaceae bacterium]|nr:BspA family leucine-rich repeat surface protein [Prevotellaceae bacterium]